MNSFPVTLTLSLELLGESASASPWGSKATEQRPRVLGPNCVYVVVRRKEGESVLKDQEQAEEKQLRNGRSRGPESVLTCKFVKIHKKIMIL
jgi:hypothetical protein